MSWQHARTVCCSWKAATAPEVRQTCKRWLDPEGRYHEFRCAEYAASALRGPAQEMRFCIDRDEYVESGESLPKNFQL
jgi:hypothetical protein